jgi:hypothetical protein
MPKVKLRQDNVRSLQYVGNARGKAQCIYWDLALPGFGLRKFPNGRGSYVCSYRIQMRKRLVDLGRSDSMTLEQARRRARLYFGAAADGKDPRSNIDQMRATATVRELAESYINGHAKLKKKTWRIDEACLNQLLTPQIWGASSLVDHQGGHREHSHRYWQKAPLLCQSIHLDCSKNV